MSDQRPLFLRILSSTRTTAILGAVALASIIYYKVTSKPPAKKKQALWSQVANNVPMLLNKDILGRAHPNGPLLTRSFFRSGDMVLVQRSKRWAAGTVVKMGTKIFVQEVGTAPLSVLPWLKASGGRFALVRVDRKDPNKLKKLLEALRSAKGSPSQKQRNETLLALYKKAGFKFPTPAKAGKDPIQTQLLLLSQRSNYNDIQ